jgi:hypothetical protein
LPDWLFGAVAPGPSWLFLLFFAANISHRFPRPASAPPPALLEEPAEASDYSSVLNDGGAEVSCGDGVQKGAHLCGALRSERLLELLPPTSRVCAGGVPEE